MKKHLIISAIGSDRPGLIRDLSKAVTEAGCNVSDCRMTVLGNDFTLLLLASGTWNSVAKLESQAASLGKKLDLAIATRRTETRASRDMAPYIVDVAALDRPGVLSEVAEFFAQREINIDELSSWSYTATSTGAEMISLSLTISVAADVHIGRLRDDFTDFSDGLNLDATMEPARR